MDCTEDCVEERLEDGIEYSVVNKYGNRFSNVEMKEQLLKYRIPQNNMLFCTEFAVAVDFIPLKSSFVLTYEVRIVTERLNPLKLSGSLADWLTPYFHVCRPSTQEN